MKEANPLWPLPYQILTGLFHLYKILENEF